MRERWQCCWGEMQVWRGRDRVDECIMEEVKKWWQRRNELVYGRIEVPMNLVPYNPQTQPPPPTSSTVSNHIDLIRETISH